MTPNLPMHLESEVLAELPPDGQYGDITSVVDEPFVRVIDLVSGSQYLGRRVGTMTIWRLVWFIPPSLRALAKP